MEEKKKCIKLGGIYKNSLALRYLKSLVGHLNYLVGHLKLFMIKDFDKFNKKILKSIIVFLFILCVQICNKKKIWLHCLIIKCDTIFLRAKQRNCQLAKFFLPRVLFFSFLEFSLFRQLCSDIFGLFYSSPIFSKLHSFNIIHR